VHLVFVGKNLSMERSKLLALSNTQTKSLEVVNLLHTASAMIIIAFSLAVREGDVTPC
jgi:hypothetical protein